MKKGKNKRAMMPIEEVLKLLLAIFIFVLVLIIIIILIGKGGSALEYIKRLFMFGK